MQATWVEVLHFGLHKLFEPIMQSLHDFESYFLVIIADALLHLEKYFHEHGKVVFTLRVG